MPNNLCSEIQLLTLNNRCNEPPYHRSPGLECGGLWRFLTGVSVPDHDGEGSRLPQTTYVPNISFLH